MSNYHYQSIWWHGSAGRGHEPQTCADIYNVIQHDMIRTMYMWRPSYVIMILSLLLYYHHTCTPSLPPSSRIPSLPIVLESSPLKARILVQILAVWCHVHYRQALDTSHRDLGSKGRAPLSGAAVCRRVARGRLSGWRGGPRLLRFYDTILTTPKIAPTPGKTTTSEVLRIRSFTM